MNAISDSAESSDDDLVAYKNKQIPVLQRRSSPDAAVLALDEDGTNTVHGDDAVASALRIMLKSQREGDMKTVSRVSRDLANLLFPGVVVVENEDELRRTSKNAVELVALMASKFQAKTIHNLLPGVLPLLSGDRNLLKTVETLQRMLTVVRNNVQQLERMDEYSKHVASKHESVVHDIDTFFCSLSAKKQARRPSRPSNSTLNTADGELQDAFLKCSLQLKITACEVTITNSNNPKVAQLLDEKADELFLLAFGNEVRLGGHRVIGDAMLTAAICCAKIRSGQLRYPQSSPEWYAATTEKWFWKAGEAYQRVEHWTGAVEKQSALDACNLALARFYASPNAGMKKRQEFLLNHFSVPPPSVKSNDSAEAMFDQLVCSTKAVLTTVGAKNDPTDEVACQFHSKSNEALNALSSTLTRLESFTSSGGQLLSQDEAERWHKFVEFVPPLAAAIVNLTASSSFPIFRDVIMKINGLISDPNQRVVSVQRCWCEITKGNVRKREKTKKSAAAKLDEKQETGNETDEPRSDDVPDKTTENDDDGTQSGHSPDKITGDEKDDHQSDHAPNKISGDDEGEPQNDDSPNKITDDDKDRSRSDNLQNKKNKKTGHDKDKPQSDNHSETLLNMHNIFQLIVRSIKADSLATFDVRQRNLGRCYEHYGDAFLQNGDLRSAGRVYQDGINALKNKPTRVFSLRSRGNTKRSIYAGRLYHKLGYVLKRHKHPSTSFRKLTKAVKIFKHADGWFDDAERNNAVLESEALLKKIKQGSIIDRIRRTFSLTGAV